MTKHSSYIHSVIDKVLDFNNSIAGLQEPIYIVPNEMIREKHPKYDEIVFWKPTPANISQANFLAYENKIGFTLPDTYKDFLSYKYFISLNFGHEAIFFRHTSSWAEDYYEIIENYGFENILERGLIPFANDTDQGLFCFDTNNVLFDNEYRIVTYDKNFEEQCYGQFTFIELIEELEQRLDEWKQRRLADN